MKSILEATRLIYFFFRRHQTESKSMETSSSRSKRSRKFESLSEKMEAPGSQSKRIKKTESSSVRVIVLKSSRSVRLQKEKRKQILQLRREFTEKHGLDHLLKVSDLSFEETLLNSEQCTALKGMLEEDGRDACI